jgi:signal transduction histidine kinase
MAPRALEDALERERARARAAEERVVQLERELEAHAVRSAATTVLASELESAYDAMRRTVQEVARQSDLRSFMSFLVLELGDHLGTNTVAMTPLDRATGAFRAGVLLVDGVTHPLEPIARELTVADAKFLEPLLAAGGFKVFDVERDAELFWPGAVDFLRARGKRSSAVFAIQVDGQLFGQISFAYESAPDLTPQQVKLVKALSTQAALAIEMQRLADEARETAVARERQSAAEERAADLGKANEAIRLALAALAAEPAPQAIEIMFREIVRAAGAEAGYWFRYDDGPRTLGVTLRIERGTFLTAPADDEPELFRAPFPADVTPAFDVLCRDSSFVKLSTHRDSELMWPGTNEWHRRRGRTEALAFAVKVGAEPLGVIGLAFSDRSTMTHLQEHLVRTLSNQFALAVQMDHLAEQTKRAAVDRETGRAIANERSRMAGEIHDSLAQAFTSIALQTEALLSEVDERSPLRESLSLVEETARVGLAEARSSVLALRPVGEGDRDLELTLSALASRCCIPGKLMCRFQGGFGSHSPSADVRDAVLRVAQEALANALRHAKASQVDIHLDVVGRRVTLSIGDDGVGIGDGSISARRGLGLPGMRARAEALGGTLTVEARRGRSGTEVRLSIPADATTTPSPRPPLASSPSPRSAVPAAVESSSQARSAAEGTSDPVELLRLTTAAMRRCTDRVSSAMDPATLVPETLAAIGELLVPLGIIDVGVVEYLPASRTVAIRAILRHGVVLPLSAIDFASRSWLVDEPALRVPWERIKAGHFVWGLVGDATVLHPAAREFHVASGASSIAYQPLMRGDEAIGWLAFLLRSEAPPDEALVSLMQALASQIYLAMEMQRVAGLAQQAALERARAEAAETHVTLLQAANDALRRGTERVGQDGGLEALLGAFVLEAMQVSGASGGAITEWRNGRFSRLFTIAQDGALVPFEDYRNEPMVLETAGALSLDYGGFATAMLSQPILRSTVEDARSWWPAAAEYHARRGHVEVWNVPCALRGRMLAHLGLAFREPREMDAITVSTLTSLAQQMTLALELTYVGEAAKEAAIEVETTRAIAAERNRMAGEIHDSLAQAFTSIALQTEAMLSEVGEHSTLRESLSVVEETARIGLAEARSAALALRTVGDKHGDLELALESLAGRCTIPGTLTCTFRGASASFRLSAGAREAVLRVAQEAVANALRHARATQVEIHYEAALGRVTLSIRDDGVGIGEVARPSGSGLGLPGMQARAAALGGTLTIRAAPGGQGTEVRLSIPADAGAA